MTHPKDTTPEIFSDGVFFPSLFPRTAEEWDGIFAALSMSSMKRPRKPRKPTLESVVKQASKAGIEVGAYKVAPDGTITVVVGKPDAIATAADDEVENWLSKQKGY
jgi:nucleotide-binding universal stress UspA family protein